MPIVCILEKRCPSSEVEETGHRFDLRLETNFLLDSFHLLLASFHAKCTCREGTAVLLYIRCMTKQW